MIFSKQPLIPRIKLLGCHLAFAASQLKPILLIVSISVYPNAISDLNTIVEKGEDYLHLSYP